LKKDAEAAAATAAEAKQPVKTQKP
jgi:hypothetical protein